MRTPPRREHEGRSQSLGRAAQDHGGGVRHLDRRALLVVAAAAPDHVAGAVEPLGVGVVVVSSEVEEVLGLADRVLVMREGVVVHEAPAAHLDEAQVLDLVMEGAPS